MFTRAVFTVAYLLVVNVVIGVVGVIGVIGHCQYFVLFMVYLLIGCVFAATLSFVPFYHLILANGGQVRHWLG